MILNHRTAIELLVENIGSAEFNRYTLMNLHSALAENLLPKAGLQPRPLGVYEMTRVELLRDLYVWAYERSTQEYQAIKQGLAEPDPLRLAWRDFIKQTILRVITQPALDPLAIIQRSVAEHIPEHEQSNVQALLVEELLRLHQGVLAR